MVETSMGGALSRDMHTFRRVSSSKVLDLLGINRSRGFSLKRASISLSGFQPAKSSNLERATAISGLWLVSPYFFGSCLCNFSASFRSGWIWRGSALEKESI